VVVVPLQLPLLLPLLLLQLLVVVGPLLLLPEAPAVVLTSIVTAKTAAPMLRAARVRTPTRCFKEDPPPLFTEFFELMMCLPLTILIDQQYPQMICSQVGVISVSICC
jgi:hypothetical protein